MPALVFACDATTCPLLLPRLLFYVSPVASSDADTHPHPRKRTGTLPSFDCSSRSARLCSAYVRLLHLSPPAPSPFYNSFSVLSSLSIACQPAEEVCLASIGRVVHPALVSNIGVCLVTASRIRFRPPFRLSDDTISYPASLNPPSPPLPRPVPASPQRFPPARVCFCVLHRVTSLPLSGCFRLFFRLFEAKDLLNHAASALLQTCTHTATKTHWLCTKGTQCTMKLVVDELYRSRMLMTGVYVGLAISSTYGFSIFTEHLRNKYGFNQGDITTISTVGNCCGYMVFFAGILFDFSGPKVLFPIAGFLGFLGYFLFGLAFDDIITSKSKEVALVQFCIFNAILYFGCPAMDVATLMPLMVNFPLERGYMVIIQKTFSGLGTSVLMAYFNGWFLNLEAKDASNYSGYAYFVGSQIFFCALLGCYFIDLAPYTPCQFRRNRLTEEQAAERKATLDLYGKQHAPSRRLYIGCFMIGANLVFLTISSIVTGYVPTQKSGYVAISVIAVFLLAMFSLMALPIQFLGRYPVIEKRHPHFPSLGYSNDVPAEAEEALDCAQEQSRANREPTAVHGTADKQRVGGVGQANADDFDAVAVKDRKEGSNGIETYEEDEAANLQKSDTVEEEGVDSAPQTNVSGDPQYRQPFWRNLLTIDLWLFWISFFGMWGTGTVMQMNAAQIYRSVNFGAYDQSRLSLYVALIGVGSAIGRITSGVLDMWLIRRKATSKNEILTTTFLPIGAVLLFAAYLLFAVIPANGLIVPFLLGSIGTGMGWGLGALSVRIVYANDIGKHYNFMFSSGFVSTIALNRFMFGGMFDKEASHLGTAPNCNQPSCVRNQMFILMAVNALSTVAAVLLHLRFRRFVRQERAKQAEEALALEAKNKSD
ncbi:hypothetical protein, conserved [Leishmania tarentolae]|uniref:Nodulin-like domain-containing protein n=1 Tax=Leishmania tarentolae TaxID=5689 RepID=A0A640KM60_LEITA|nr:hypothetical protein, conserved [Leishmania tarentolae]